MWIFWDFDLFSHLPVIACKGTFVTSGHEALSHLGPLYSEILVGVECTIDERLLPESFIICLRYFHTHSFPFFVYE